ncbi:DUF2860 domain-containing protein [Endozoicomonas sp. Mp262]|uniref:DUF2860 domain-containing protein n=1 Tax=Endozoicomonas sp. Mp262 TaxID=2919499 RepID=UPI0021D90FC9
MLKELSVGLVAYSMSAVAAAQPPQQWEPGFSGEVSILAGFTHKHSQFNTDNKSTSTLDQSGGSQGKYLMAPMGLVRYTFADQDRQLFFGSSRSDLALGNFYIEAGYRQSFQQNGTMSFSIIPGVISTKTWADPFITGEDREETRQKRQAVRFQYKNIMGSDFSIELAAGKTKVDEEKSGQRNYTDAQQELLKREGNIFLAKGSHRYKLSRNLFLRSALIYMKDKADGDAMASNAYGIEGGIVSMQADSTLALTLSYKQARFDETNPVFGEKQKDHRYSAFLAYSYDEPFSLKDWDFIALTGYNYTHSNIDFYEEKSLLLMAGLSYKF